MSTLKNNITAKRLALLATKGELIFHTGDLANLWGITGNNLRTTLKRYHQQRLLRRIYRGLYSLIPIDQLDPLLLGTKVLHQYCYLSTESILYEAGIIAQPTASFTFVSSISKQIFIGKNHYLSRQLADHYLFQTNGIIKEKGILKATPERAVADMLYYNPWYHFDKPVDWENLKKLQQQLGYPLTPHRYAAPKTR